MNDPVIECIDLHKTYHLGKTTVEALRGLTMQINRGEFVAIIGVSGSGKSTLMHLIGALDTPDCGVVSIDGENLSDHKSARFKFTKRISRMKELGRVPGHCLRSSLSEAERF